MGDPRDQGKSSNAIHDSGLEIILSYLHSALLVTKTSPESVWEKRTYKHESQEARIIGFASEASYHNAPYQSTAGHDRCPAPSTYNDPSPNLNNGLAAFHNCLSFLLHSASLFQRSFTNFLLAKKELSSMIGHICAAKSKHNFVEFGGLKFASLLSNEVKTNH